MNEPTPHGVHLKWTEIVGAIAAIILAIFGLISVLGKSDARVNDIDKTATRAEFKADRNTKEIDKDEVRIDDNETRIEHIERVHK